MYIIKHKTQKLYLASYTMNVWSEYINKAIKFDLKVPDKNLPEDSICIDINDVEREEM